MLSVLMKSTVLPWRSRAQPNDREISDPKYLMIVQSRSICVVSNSKDGLKLCPKKIILGTLAQEIKKGKEYCSTHNVFCKHGEEIWVFILCLYRIHAFQSPFIHQTTALNSTAMPARTPRVMSHSKVNLADLCLRSPSVPLLRHYKIIGWKPKRPQGR